MPVYDSEPIGEMFFRPSRKVRSSPSGFPPRLIASSNAGTLRSSISKNPAQEHGEEGDEDKNGGAPPEPMNALRLDAYASEFAAGELLVIEILIGQVEPASGIGIFAPTREMVGSTFRAS